MAILPGIRPGPYEILSAIGAGGMGEVYKARDTRLDRIVAIKVLPTYLADRTNLRERFEREAKKIGSAVNASMNLDLDSDGKRIVALMPVDTPEGQKAQNHVIFLENFFDDVRRRTATQAK